MEHLPPMYESKRIPHKEKLCLQKVIKGWSFFAFRQNYSAFLYPILYPHYYTHTTMRFFALALVTLAAMPVAFSQPIKVERVYGEDLAANIAPHGAREPNPTFLDMIERSAITREDTSALEARGILFDAFELAGKGIKWLTQHIHKSSNQQKSSPSSQNKTTAKPTTNPGAKH